MWNEPEPEQLEELIERVSDFLVRRQLGVIGIIMLESSKPLTLAGSQLLIFLAPLVRCFLQLPDYPLLVHLLEDRRRVEQLIRAIERKEDGRA
ncbi:MAG: hypothetical protein HY319_08495 [Armatimonadetes bacterium]|nr:hypothetical protein [Armatimonadota bacterium]